MNIEWIELPCEPHHSLDWKSELVRARNASRDGKKIFWKFGLGLEQPFFPLEDELRFQSLKLALIQFSKDVWPEFESSTEGLVLYKGLADLVFSWTEKQQANFSDWIEEEDLLDTPANRRLFCLEAFAIYFQMLSHSLPDEAPVFLFFDLSGFGSHSAVLSALGKERFEHFHLATSGYDLPREGVRFEGDRIFLQKKETNTGIVFPENRDAHEAFDRFLNEVNSPIRVVFEAFMSEEWEGLDRLYVFSKKTSPQGERMLKGFAAAGGEVIQIV